MFLTINHMLKIVLVSYILINYVIGDEGNFLVPIWKIGSTWITLC